MSPNKSFPPDEEPQDVITQRLLAHPRVTYDTSQGVLVAAIRDELLVSRATRLADSSVDEHLRSVADNVGALGDGLDMEGEFDPVELWRLKDPDADSIDEARRVREFAPDRVLKGRRGEVAAPSISPNHVCVVSHFHTCPFGPPAPVPAPPEGEAFIPAAESPEVDVVVIDTGYIITDPAHTELDLRVTRERGRWLDSGVIPPTWRPSQADELDADGDSSLDGVAGHGTFIAGIIANRCANAKITVVGLRHECMSSASTPDDQAMLFTSELAVSHALLRHARADVVLCGFAFPTLDGLPSTPFSSVLQLLSGEAAPRHGLAVVAPAGNESSAVKYWPAAHPDVIGVGASNSTEDGVAPFSNWGDWLRCSARGEDVTSTFIYWKGPIEEGPAGGIEDFGGWASWNGTSFAAPKVAAAIATCLAQTGDPPVVCFEELVMGGAGVAVTALDPGPGSVAPGVVLPNLLLG